MPPSTTAIVRDLIFASLLAVRMGEVRVNKGEGSAAVA